MGIVPGFIRRRIAHRPNFVKIVDNFGWLFYDKLLRMGVALVVGAWLARYLGPEQFGLLSYAIAFVGLFGALATFGLEGIVVRDIVREPEAREEILGTAAFLQLIGGVIAYGLIIILIFWLKSDDPLTRVLVTTIGLTMLFKASDVVVYWFQSQVQSKYTVWVQNGVFLVFAVVKIWLILNDASLIAFAYVMVADAGFVAIILFIMLEVRGPKIRQLCASFRRAKILLTDSWPLALSGIVLMVQARIDQIMLADMVGAIEVGYYSVALTIVESAAFSAMLLRASFLPSIIQSKENSTEIYNKKLESFCRLNIAVALFIAVPLALLSGPIISILFGSEYAAAAVIMSVMSFRLVFAHIGVSRSVFLLNENLLRYSAVTMVIATICNIVLNYFLIPMFAGIGAVLASLVSFFVATVILDLFYAQTRQFTCLILKSFLTFWSIFRKKSWVL